MSNFDVSVVYCCPCVLKLVKIEIQKRNVLTQALLTDFIKAKFDQAILIELITCTKHLHECLYFDYEWCNHYSRERLFFRIK